MNTSPIGVFMNYTIKNVCSLPSDLETNQELCVGDLVTIVIKDPSQNYSYSVLFKIDDIKNGTDLYLSNVFTKYAYVSHRRDEEYISKLFS